MPSETTLSNALLPGLVALHVPQQLRRRLVLRRLGRRLHVFDAEGSHLRSIGRKGEGPGEFMLPQTIAIEPEHTIWVGDVMLRRMSVFNAANGELLEMQSGPWIGNSLRGLPFGPDGKYTRVDRAVSLGRFARKFGNKGRLPFEN